MKKSTILIILFLILSQITIYALGFGRINIDSINITSNPNYDSKALDNLSKHDYISVLEKSNNFYKIKAPSGSTGWIDSYFVNLNPNKYFINTCGTNANVRMSPTTNSQIVGYVKNDDKIKYLDTFHSWYVVEYEGMEAFVASWLGDIISDGSSSVYFIDEVINIRTSPSLEGEVLNLGYKYQNFKFYGEEKGWFKLEVDNNTYGYAAGWLMSTSNNFSINNIISFEKTIDNLRLRTNPSLSSNIIKVMPSGTEVRVVQHKNEWSKIVTWDGIVGYCHNDYLIKSPPLVGKKILLNPGHGGNDPGAISPTGKYEKNVNLKVAFEVKDILTKLGAEVVMTRESDVYVDRVTRANLADKINADIMFSIHHNSLNDYKYYGMSTYYDTKDNDSGKESSKLAEYVYNRVVSINSIYRDGIYDRNFEILRSTNTPAALIEIGFISNSWEEKNIQNSSFQYQVSKQITFGIVDYFKSN